MPVNMNTYNVAYKSRVYIDDMQYRYNVVNG